MQHALASPSFPPSSTPLTLLLGSASSAAAAISAFLADSSSRAAASACPLASSAYSCAFSAAARALEAATTDAWEGWVEGARVRDQGEWARGQASARGG